MANNNKSLEKTGTPVTRRSVAQATQANKTDENTGQIPSRARKRKRTTTAGQPQKTTNTAVKQPQVATSNTTQKTVTQKNVNEVSAKESSARRKNNDTSIKDRMQKTEKKARKNEEKRKASAGRNFMITLMVVFFIAAAIIGGWGVSQFFWFYVQEKSPVMAAGTENSRVENTPDIDLATFATVEEGIVADGGPVSSVTIHQVGPTIHYLIVLNEDANKDNAYHAGNVAIQKTNDALGNQDLFNVYEAQIIVTKENLKVPDEDVMLRPAADSGEEQTFPQYGVMNKNTRASGANISWSRNG